jgi:hypothetical protein
MRKLASIEHHQDGDAPQQQPGRSGSGGHSVSTSAVNGSNPSAQANPPRNAGAAVDAFAVLESLTGSIEAPADWAAEHDHYLYGTPKRGR